MHILNPQTPPQRLTRILDEGWEILMQRIATSRVTINKEASLQLHYSSILLSYGELFCVEPRETFTIELESANGRKSMTSHVHLAKQKPPSSLSVFERLQTAPATRICMMFGAIWNVSCRIKSLQ